jgi:hypothetical protein
VCALVHVCGFALFWVVWGGGGGRAVSCELSLRTSHLAVAPPRTRTSQRICQGGVDGTIPLLSFGVRSGRRTTGVPTEVAG